MTMVFSLSKIFHSIEWLLDTKKKKYLSFFLYDWRGKSIVAIVKFCSLPFASGSDANKGGGEKRKEKGVKSGRAKRLKGGRISRLTTRRSYPLCIDEEMDKYAMDKKIDSRNSFDSTRWTKGSSSIEFESIY